MPVNYSKVVGSVLPPTVEIAAFNSAADSIIYSIARFVYEAGWGVNPIYPRFIFKMPIDMSPFLITGGTDQAIQWLLIPIDPAVKPMLIVDDLRGYTVPPEWSYFETGTIDVDSCYDIILRLYLETCAPVGMTMEKMSTFGTGISKYTVCQIIYPLSGLPPFIFQMIDHGGIGVALNASVTNGCANGGYSCLSQDAGGGAVSFVISRAFDVDGNNNKGPIFFRFAINAEGLPDVDQSNPSEQSPAFTIGLPYSHYTMFASEFTFFLKMTSPDYSGHIEMASLIPIGGETEDDPIVAYGAFSVGAGDNFFNNSFQLTPSCNGIMLLQYNGGHLFSANFGKHTPRVTCLWSLDDIGTLWENGLGEILEPRVALSISESIEAGIVGSLPYAIVVHKSLSVEDTPPFTFDEIVYRVYTNNAVSSFGSPLGTLCFGTPEDGVSGECEVH